MSVLTVRDNAWHYRLWKWQKTRAGELDAKPKDLCSYFWGVVGIIAGFVFLPFAVLYLAFLIVLFVIAVLGNWLLLLIIPGAILGVATLLLLVIGLVLLWDRYAPKPSPELRGTFVTIRHVLEAKKRRFCPLIEVKP